MNDINEKLHSSLVQTIYSAPFESDGWEGVLSQLMRSLDSQWAQIHISDFVAPGIPLSSLYPFEEAALTDYVDHYVNVDPRSEILTLRDNKPRSRSDIVSDKCFRKSEIFNDFLSLYGAEQSLIVPIEGTTAGINFVAVMQSEKSGHYGSQQTRVIQPLICHIQQSILIQRRIIDSRTQRLASTAILNSLDVGVFFLTRNGHVLFSNAAAKRITDSKDGFVISHLGHLKARRESESRSLNKAIDNAIRANRRNLVSDNRSFSISRSAAGLRYHVLVAAVSIEHSHRIAPEVCAIVFVTDPLRATEYPVLFLKGIYGLTPTEAKLAMAIANGSTVETYCDENHVSVHTARTQLKKVLNKCGVNRQSDLVRLVLQNPASNFRLFD